MFRFLGEALGDLCGICGEVADFVGHHRESAPGVASFGGLNLGVEGKQSDAHVDVVDLPQRVVHLAGDALGEVADAFDPVIKRIGFCRMRRLGLLSGHKYSGLMVG